MRERGGKGREVLEESGEFVCMFVLLGGKDRRTNRHTNSGVYRVSPTNKKSQHGCVRWALREHLTPPCSEFACGGLEDQNHINKKNRM